MVAAMILFARDSRAYARSLAGLLRDEIQSLLQNCVLPVQQFDHPLHGHPLALELLSLEFDCLAHGFQLRYRLVLGSNLHLQLVDLRHEVVVLCLKGHLPLLAPRSTVQEAVHGTLRLQRSVQHCEPVQVVDVAVEEQHFLAVVALGQFLKMRGLGGERPALARAHGALLAVPSGLLRRGVALLYAALPLIPVLALHSR